MTHADQRVAQAVRQYQQVVALEEATQQAKDKLDRMVSDFTTYQLGRYSTATEDWENDRQAEGLTGELPENGGVMRQLQQLKEAALQGLRDNTRTGQEQEPHLWANPYGKGWADGQAEAYGRMLNAINRMMEAEEEKGTVQ